MLFIFSLGVALAGAPTTVVLDDGSIVGSVSVRAPVELARSRVSDPLWVARAAGETRVSVAGKEGDCLLLESVSPSVVMEVRYATRQCPTSDGVRATLRSSNAFSDYATSWRVTPEGAGSRLEYRFFMRTKLMLPQSFITGTTRKKVQELMEKVGAALGT